MPRDSRHAGPPPTPAPVAVSRPRVVVRLLTRPNRQARWELVGEYVTREAAWDVLVRLPSGSYWLNDVLGGERSAPTPARRVH